MKKSKLGYLEFLEKVKDDISKKIRKTKIEIIEEKFNNKKIKKYIPGETKMENIKIQSNSSILLEEYNKIFSNDITMKEVYNNAVKEYGFNNYDELIEVMENRDITDSDLVRNYFIKD